MMFDEHSSEKLKGVLSERFKAASKASFHAGEMAHVQEKPLLVEVLESTVSKETTDLPVAPSLRLSAPLKSICFQLTLPLDVLALVHWDTPLRDVATCLKKSICAQLEAIATEMKV